MKIQKARKKDARKISYLIRGTINKINAKDYPKKQLEHELSCYTIKRIKEYIKKGVVFCVFSKERLIGAVVLNYKEKTLNSLYLKSKYIGKGIGKRLLEFIEKQAKKKKIKELKLYPTKFAISFYKKQGYKITRRFIGTENGGFPVIEMKKRLR